MRTHIDYGIYFNDDFCQIARMEDGIPVIKLSDTMKKSVPLCVHFNKRGDILIGDAAYNVIKNDQIRALKSFGACKTNSFIQFTRTLGTSHSYESSNTGNSYSSEKLLGECFKKLKSFVHDEEVKAVVITFPAKFTITQIEAVNKAGQFAGFEQIELIPEPIAASINFGLGSNSKNGHFLVFDFQSEFNVSLCKADDGIISIVDSDGDNWLGDKNITEAIVDEIIIPYLKDNYDLDSIFQDSYKKESLINYLRHYAEVAKYKLNHHDSYCILSSLGDLPFEDKNGNEPELDIELTQQELLWVSRPIYQKTIYKTIDLLKRNNKKSKDIEYIILVGEETYSPILRNLLKEQISNKIDTSTDPTTLIVKGAALYGSSIPIAEKINKQTKDKTVLKLDIKYETTTVELDEIVNIKLLKEKTVGTFPEKVFVEVVRSDGAWSSGKKQIREKASIVEVVLNAGQSNFFYVNVNDEAGNKIECRPNQFSILQGIGGLDGIQVLPYHIGIAKYLESEGKELFQPIIGLEKNRQLPATGVINRFKTEFDLRPGIGSDAIRIPIYQGDYNAEGTNPLLNNHVFDILISGETLPTLLPAGSTINITIKVNNSQLMTVIAEFPEINYTTEIKLDIRQSHPISRNDIEKIKSELVLFYSDNPSMGKERFRFLLGELIKVGKNELGQYEKMRIVDLVKKELIKWI